jgi:hypothetical protein
MARPGFPVWLLAVLLALVTISLYWPATGHDFVNYDDTAYVTDNPRVQAGLTLESALFLSDLLTGHEPDRVSRVLRRRKQCGRCDPLVPCARWKDWFRWWTSAHFGEARVGFPVGKICFLQNSTGLSVSGPITL